MGKGKVARKVVKWRRDFVREERAFDPGTWGQRCVCQECWEMRVVGRRGGGLDGAADGIERVGMVRTGMGMHIRRAEQGTGPHH